MTSSFVVASHSVDDGWTSTRTTSHALTPPGTQRDASLINSTAATPPVGVQRPAASPLSPATSTTTAVASPPATGGDRSRPDTEVDRSTYDGENIERPSNRTKKPRDDDDDDNDGGGGGGGGGGGDFRRRRFHRISAAQVNYVTSSTHLAAKHHGIGSRTSE